MNNVSGTNYFALQVRTKGEEKFIRQARSVRPGASIYFPKRVLDIRKMGKVKPTQFAIFPGYVFLELDAEENVNRYQFAFRKIDSFYRFLGSGHTITPLKERDLEIVLHFIKIGPVAEKSKVYFDENSRIVVLHGPLSGLEGKIVNVDRRKRRAKIVLDLYDDKFSIDLAFDVIEKTAVQNYAPCKNN